MLPLPSDRITKPAVYMDTEDTACLHSKHFIDGTVSQAHILF